MEGFGACFEGLEDPRTGNAGRHELLEILMIALCTVLCGGQTAVDMAEFAENKEAFRRGFLNLAQGPPGHDTFSRVLRLLDPDQFRACCQRFMARFAETAQGVVAIDGKVPRRSFDRASGKSALHRVTAWGGDQRPVLAQIAPAATFNEITAGPKPLEMLSLKGTIVTVDALNCQRDIARRIVDQDGDYVLALKGTQGTLHADVRLFRDEPETRPMATHTTVDGDHGRIETRTCTLSTDLGWRQEVHDWPGLNALGKVIRTRESGAKMTTETAYYLLSAPLSAERCGHVARSHWAVENSPHWCLDVIINEDNARNRLDNGPYNLAILRHMALNLIRKEPSSARSPHPQGALIRKEPSSARSRPRAPCASRSSGRDGRTHTSPKSSPKSEMRLPCISHPRLSTEHDFDRARASRKFSKAPCGLSVACPRGLFIPVY